MTHDDFLFIAVLMGLALGFAFAIIRATRVEDGDVMYRDASGRVCRVVSFNVQCGRTGEKMTAYRFVKKGAKIEVLTSIDFLERFDKI